MTTLAIISDTHGALTTENFQGLFPSDSKIITLGDISSKELKIIKSRHSFLGGVKGNCDSNNLLPKSGTLEVQNIRIFMTHDPARLKIPSRREDQNNGYDIVLFGHLHKRYHVEDGGIVYFSPGSFVKPRDHFGPSAGIIEIKEGEFDFRFVDVVL